MNMIEKLYRKSLQWDTPPKYLEMEWDDAQKYRDELIADTERKYGFAWVKEPLQFRGVPIRVTGLPEINNEL